MQEDIEYIAQSDMVEWDMLKGKSVLVTGATGLIGSQIVLALDRYNQLHEGHWQEMRKRRRECLQAVVNMSGSYLAISKCR